MYLFSLKDNNIVKKLRKSEQNVPSINAISPNQVSKWLNERGMHWEGVAYQRCITVTGTLCVAEASKMKTRHTALVLATLWRQAFHVHPVSSGSTSLNMSFAFASDSIWIMMSKYNALW